MSQVIIKRLAAAGDVLLAAAIAPALKRKYDKIYFYTNYPEIIEGNPYVDGFAKTIDGNVVNLDGSYENKSGNILKTYADVAKVNENECFLYLKTEKIDIPKEYIVIHNGRTGWVGKEWHDFDFIAKALKLKKETVVCIGTNIDYEVYSDIDLRGKTTIHQLAYVIKHAKLFIGIDSFPMHVCQTFRTKGVCFFGSTNPDNILIKNSSIKPIQACNISCLGCHHRQPKPCFVTNKCSYGEICSSYLNREQMFNSVLDLLS